MRTIAGGMASIFLCCALFIGTAFAEESIPTFDARIIVHENATIEVIEAIVYDFGSTKRHGIFRNIPYSYQAGNETYTADISSVLVTDGNGMPRPFQESRGNGELELKIGDPNVEVSGIQTYIISYIVDGPFLYFDTDEKLCDAGHVEFCQKHDEFYWNVTGSWSRAIQSASVLIDLPKGAQILSAACYQGEAGSSRPCSNEQRLVNVERAGYQASAENLAPKEGFTVAVAFPEGTIAKVEKQWNMREFIPPYAFWPFLLPILVLLCMIHRWYTRGRDPKGRSAIVTEFSPPLGVSPALASVLDNEWVQAKDISAEIIRLATEGYIKIYRYDRDVLFFDVADYLLERVREEDPGDPIGSLLMRKLFQDEFIDTVDIDGTEKTGVLLSKMKHNFANEKKAITERVYDEAVVQDFFKKRPDTIRVRYIVGGVAAAIAGIVLTVMLSSSVQGAFLGVALAISGIIVAIVGNWMPVKTTEGVRVREHLEGFKRYLTIAEKDRIAFHDSPEKAPAPEKNIELFSAFLPFAIMFGIEKEWAEQFEGMFEEEPQWYAGTRGSAFTVGALTSDLSSFSQNMSSAMAPQSSGASGGGSVGGGFGGGGGGSW